MERISIVVAHSSALIRECLGSIIDREPGFTLLGQLAHADQVIEEARTLSPDVVVLDLHMPCGGGLVADIRHAAPETRVLILGHDRVDTAAEVMQAGANGYLDYNCGVRQMIHSIERVKAGDVVLMAMPTECQGPNGSRPGANAPVSLTSRERDVLQLVAEGRTNTEVAAELCITNHTVKGHLSNILHKLGLQNRVQLAAYAMEHRMNRVIREPVRAGDIGASRSM